MKTVAIIPARFGSTRLPAKALLRDTGKFLVQHVYESVAGCDALDRVIIATDDERIVEAVRSFGGDVCMTRAEHQSGTDRVAEAAAALRLADDDLVLNVQGDEPEIRPEVVTALVNALRAPDSPYSIATVAAPFDDEGPREGSGSPHDPNRVKVVLDGHGGALYFSRSLIPYPRDSGEWVDRPSRWLLHMGLYGFKWAALRSLTSSRVRGQNETDLHQRESLEQLRWLAGGYRIAVAVVSHRFVGIDTPEDYAAFVQRVQSSEATASCR